MRHLFAIVIVIICSVDSIAQFTYGPVVNPHKYKNSLNNRTESVDTLSLPFWDDFSFTEDNIPSDSLWQNSQSVYVGNGLGKNPPSIGVASLDGVNADGLGYAGGSVGPTDALTSCPIDLSGLSVSDNVYLSFYYQFAGNGESPEEEDSLRVEMFNADGLWITVWPGSTSLDRSGNFVQQLIRLDSTNFFHEGFQFRFQSFGRPTGFFDLWNIDYVYLNKNRSLADNHYPDRTIATPLSSIFNGYTSIPSKHFNSNQVINPTYKMTSIDDPADISGQTFECYYNFMYSAWKNNVIIGDTIIRAHSIGDNPSLKPSEIRTITHNNFSSITNIPTGQDSVFVEITTYSETNDNAGDYEIRFTPIDFRWNDTIRNSFVLKDYYAYDDGSAEFAAGLNFSGNQLAIKYPMPPNLTDTLMAVDIHFPLSKNEPAGRSVDVIVWDWNSNDGIPGDVLYRESITILRDPKPNIFTRYFFKNLVIVNSTFLIGYRQNNEGVLGVGFDIDNNSSQHVYFNIGSTWQQKQGDDLKGSFMIRPIFGKTIPDPTTGVDDVISRSYNIYPNPTNGQLTIQGQYETLSIFDLYGRTILDQQIILKEELTHLDLSHQPNGIYLIRLTRGNKSETYKVIKR